MLDYTKKLKPGGSTVVNATEPAEAAPTPALSQADENFLEAALQSADGPVVIFAGPAEEVQSGSSTSASSTTETSKSRGWKGTLTTGWEGLKYTISSSSEKHRAAKEEKQKAKEKRQKEKKEEEEEAKEEKGKAKEEKRKAKEEKGKAKEEKGKAEEDELMDALDHLNLATVDGRAFSLSRETKLLLSGFTQILKDISKGAPAAYSDLTTLLESSSKQLEEIYTNLPSFLQKLIKSLPSKLEPGVLRLAITASPALAVEGGLREIVTSPGLLMSLLKSVVNLLKTRFPTLLGANAALSMALFVVLLVLWYFYKRGKEVRLEGEAKEQAELEMAQVAASAGAIEGDLEGEAKEQVEVEMAQGAASASAVENDLDGEAKEQAEVKIVQVVVSVSAVGVGIGGGAGGGAEARPGERVKVEIVQATSASAIEGALKGESKDQPEVEMVQAAGASAVDGSKSEAKAQVEVEKVAQAAASGSAVKDHLEGGGKG